MNSPFKKIIIALLLGVLIILLLLLGNKIYTLKSSPQVNSAVLTDRSEGVKIGFSLGTLKEERWIKDRDIFMAKVRDLGGDILVQNANNDDEDQLKQVKYLLEQNIDVLVIVPNDLQKAAAAVELAREAGVKVISYDRLVLSSNVDLYITFDNNQVGKLLAEHLIRQVPQGNYLIINGAKSDNNTKMIKEGYDSVLSPQIEKGNINIITEEWAEQWMAEYAFQITDELVQKGLVIDGILTGNDGLAGGAIKALSEHRLAGKVKVVGQDADLAACQRIVEGTQYMTVYKPLDRLAKKAAELAVRLAKNRSLNISQTIYDGKYYVPYEVLEPIAVTGESLDQTVINDGFHSKDDVYRYIKN